MAFHCEHDLEVSFAKNRNLQSAETKGSICLESPLLLACMRLLASHQDRLQTGRRREGNHLNARVLSVHGQKSGHDFRALVKGLLRPERPQSVLFDRVCTQLRGPSVSTRSACLGWALAHHAQLGKKHARGFDGRLSIR